ncbi:MAG TPA: formate/nitrite transporter family protein [Rhodocyclaceae bacterium]
MEENERQQRADRIEERTTPRTPVIYETVRRLGATEMERPAVSLWWSGIAAGLSISFSLLAEGILALHLPDAPWRELVVALGYPVGFVMVVLARQQLFTENTITVVLPVMAEPTPRNLWRAARLWGIVLAANLAGTLAAAALIAFTPAVPPELLDSMLDVARRGMDHEPLEMAFLGVTSGYLMATMVWLIPAAREAQFHVVVLMTYLIGVGGFAHIVAGSVESFLLLLTGELPLQAWFTQFLLPVLPGNIVGGTVLFALISYAQVMKEM